ncbi:ABC transporter ATP-binding protein [Rubinisphaera margarita]|uniref:ABC transporter ATP-binding protein n=1 Tax=Rubinisphaera margarita TaxID=2909586 RepID=UPI001EE96174|nr:ABC transporter ATP-binding protein [Rubinisphaera margarita]MCG6155172.1 ABC transporter ATP-binding protein [Rubinisphaera margarita]
MSNPAEERYVEMSNLIKAYPNPYGDDIKVIDGFNLKIRKGEVVGVIGHSGCGKSTVLTMLAGLNPITSGGIIVDGREISGPGPDRAVVFQSPCLLPWMTAYGNVKLGVDRVYPHATPQMRHDLIAYYLGIVGLSDAMHRYPRELSGGMQQRVGIARAIALQPKVLLLDEPFGRLDSLTRMELQDVILEILDREQLTTVLITHDVDEAIYMCDRVCMMTNGPGAKVGNLMSIPFERPRRRAEILEHADYYNYRGELICFLEEQEELKGDRPAKSEPNNGVGEDTRTDLAAQEDTSTEIPVLNDELESRVADTEMVKVN